MVVYAFYIFDRHAECIYKRKWHAHGGSSSGISGSSARPSSSSAAASGGGSISGPSGGGSISGPSGGGAGAGAGVGTSGADAGDEGGASQNHPQHQPVLTYAAALSDADDARLVFGAAYSLRNMVRKLGGEEDSFVSYRTAQYKLHYYETPTSLKFIMLTDTRTNNLRIVLHQIYVGLFVEYVVKNPLSPTEHPNGLGVYNEMFELGLDQFISGALQG